MKKILTLAAMICVLNVLAGMAIAGYLFGTGRLDASKMRVIGDLVRHPGTPDKLREKVGEILEAKGPPATTSAPASQPANGALAIEGSGGAAREPIIASAEERVRFARQAMEQERIQLERQAQALRDQQKLLENTLAELNDRREKFAAEKKAFAPKAAGADDRIKAENFQKMLALYDELKSKQVKDLFMDSKNEEQVASYLTAMDPSRAAKIIGEFKTDPERKFMDTVLERIRVAGTSSASGPRAGGDVAAAAPRP